MGVPKASTTSVSLSRDDRDDEEEEVVPVRGNDDDDDELPLVDAPVVVVLPPVDDASLHAPARCAPSSGTA